MPDEMKRKKNEERMAFLNEKAEEMAQLQEADLVVDYDEALAEHRQKNKPHLIRFKGKTFEIPRSMPFTFSLFYMRHCIQRKSGKTVFAIPEDRIAEFIEKMFGKDFLETLDQSDVDFNFVLGRLVPDIMSMWGYKVDDTKGSSSAKNG
jgi:hypothetical protein